MFPSLTNADGRPFDQVQLTGMLMSCVIGIFPSERSRKQPVTIDLCLYLNTKRAAQSANIHDTIDYGGAVKEIAFILDHCEFQLIETAVEAICRHFLWTYQADHKLPAVDAIMVRISKPSALTHGIIPAVQITRHREDYAVKAENMSGTRIFKIHDASDSSLHLLVAEGENPLDVRKLLPAAENALPFGRWTVDGQTVKNRAPIALSTATPLCFCPAVSSSGQSHILLVQCRPTLG
jgi:dihydroneopterin aldolase